MKRTVIYACIVLYHPDNDRLKQNVEHIASQVEKILFVSNDCDLREAINTVANTRNGVLIDFGSNRGIAAALNAAASLALSEGAEWLLTLDQDTVCNDDIIAMYLPYLSLPHVGMFTCLYNDRNLNILQESSNRLIEPVSWCITSGSLLNLSIWKIIGGFDDRLFIDAVDYDYCLMLGEHNYQILQVNRVGFIHEIGEGKIRRVGPFKVRTWNHSAFRRYYSARNMILIAKKHQELSVLRSLLGVIKHTLIIFIFEDCKREKFLAACRGIIDAFRGEK